MRRTRLRTDKETRQVPAKAPEQHGRPWHLCGAARAAERARQHDAAMERQRAQAAAPQVERQHAKERAWVRYYRSPADCERSLSWGAQVECGNHYIRAKAEFDEQWDDPR